MTVLSAAGVTVSLGRRRIVHGVDLEVAAGQVLGLVGPNGAGKTTLLRALCDLLPMDSGVVRFDGLPLKQIPRRERARSLAYLPQSGRSHWSVTVETLVAMGRLPHRSPWGGPTTADRVAIARAMEAMDVAGFASRPVTELSGGELARVMLARIWAGEPRVLLADEPVSSLDPYYRIEVMEHLQSLANGGVAVVVVLHDLALAARFCSSLALLDAGRVVHTGAPMEVLTPERLAHVYRIAAIVGDRQGQPYVVPWERFTQSVLGKAAE